MRMLATITGAYGRAFAGLPRHVWLLAAATLVNRAGTMVQPFLALYLTDRRAFVPERVGVVLALYGLGSLVGSLVGGWLADRIGPVRVMILSLVAAGSCFFALGMARGLVAIAACAFLASALGDAYRPALLAGAASLVPRHDATRAMSLVRLAINLGMTVGPAVGGLIAAWRYEAIFVLDAVTCWAAAGVLYVTLDRVGATRAVPAAVGVRGGSPLGDPQFLVFLLLVGLLGAAFFQLLGAWPLHLRTVDGLSPAAVGGLLALNASIVALTEMLVVRRLEAAAPLRVVAWGALLVCLGFAILPLGRGVALAAVSVLIWTAGEILSLPFANAIAAARAPEGAGGRYMGAYAFAYSAAFAAAPAAGTVAFARLGPALLWGSIGGLGVVLFVAFRLLDRTLAVDGRVRPAARAEGASGS